MHAKKMLITSLQIQADRMSHQSLVRALDDAREWLDSVHRADDDFIASRNDLLALAEVAVTKARRAK